MMKPNHHDDQFGPNKKRRLSPCALHSCQPCPPLWEFCNEYDDDKCDVDDVDKHDADKCDGDDVDKYDDDKCDGDDVDKHDADDIDWYLRKPTSLQSQWAGRA